MIKLGKILEKLKKVFSDSIITNNIIISNNNNYNLSYKNNIII